MRVRALQACASLAVGKGAEEGGRAGLKQPCLVPGSCPSPWPREEPSLPRGGW